MASYLIIILIITCHLLPFILYKRLTHTVELIRLIFVPFLSSPQIPAQLFLDWSKKLSGTGDKWAVLGSKLGLITTDDINFYKDNPYRGGNGQLILRMWKDSDCSYKELVAALRDEDIRLDKLAGQIESHFAAV